MKKSWLYALGGIAGLVVIFRITEINKYITLQNIQAHTQYWCALVNAHYITAVLLYVAISMMSIMSGLPAVMPLSLLAGYLFGSYTGIIYAMIGVVGGSLISFLLFRYVLRNVVRRHYARTLDRLSTRINKFGMSYFLILYFSSVVPSFLINAVAALSTISLPTFLVMTTIGSLPMVIIFAMAGSQLHSITSLYDVFSPTIICLLIMLVLIACIPIAMRYYMRSYHPTDQL